MKAIFGAVLALALAGCPSPKTTPEPRTPVPEPRVVSGAPDARALLDADSIKARAAGASELRVLGADFVTEGDRIGAFVEIPDGACAVAIARSSPTIGDIDLYAFEDDGSAFATDESPDPQASILVCPPHPKRLYVVTRVMAGAGLVGVGVQTFARADLDAVARAVSARARPGEDTARLDAWPGLDAIVRAHRAALGGKWEDVRRVAVPLAPRAATRVAAVVEPNRCLDVLVVPNDDISSIETAAEDDQARVVARGRDLGRERAFVFCASARREISIAIRPRASQGLAAVVFGRSSLGGEVELASGTRVTRLATTIDLDQAKKELARDLAGKDDAAAKSIATGNAKIGSRVSENVDLPQGCARVDVLAGKPLVDVSATLWDDRGAPIAEGAGGSGATLFACGAGGSARLDLEANVSPGPFAIELRKESASPALLVAHPVAASHLLARLNAGGEVAPASAAKDAQLFALDASLKKIPFTIAQGSCTEVIAAIGDGASAIDLRLVDETKNEDSITRAESVASDRLCAGAAAVPARAELRALGGKTDALVLVRSR